MIIIKTGCNCKSAVALEHTHDEFEVVVVRLVVPEVLGVRDDNDVANHDKPNEAELIEFVGSGFLVVPGIFPARAVRAIPDYALHHQLLDQRLRLAWKNL